MSYDVMIIGSGPGGYVAAIKAAQLGLKTAIVEKDKTFGGTCLNVGCIPSKALLHASEMFEEANKSFSMLGIDIGTPKLDLDKMLAHKEATIDANVSGVAFLLKKNKVDCFKGVGRILESGRVEVKTEDGQTQVLEGKNIIIATGSVAASLPGVNVEIDEKTIVSSTGALSLSEVPKRMIVIGGGVIGLELGSVWARLGAEVLVLEYLDRPLMGADVEIAKAFQRSMEKQGLVFQMNAKVISVEKQKKKVCVTFEKIKEDNKTESVDADVVLIATGRRPFVEGLGLEEAGVKLDERGRVQVDACWQTNVPGIYAIGDVIAGPMLAHKAEEEAVAVVESLAGQAGHVNYDVIPSVVYTEPEVASVGKTEDELKKAGVSYRVGKFPFTANGRARAMLHTEGFVKILVEEKTDRILGAHIFGHNAGEMIHELAVLMEFGGSAEDLARTCHAHPTMSEAVREAGLAAFFKPLHM